MRLSGSFAVSGAVAGLLTTGLVAAGLAVAPASAAGAAVRPGTARVTAASAPPGVRAPYAELENAATGADMWSRTSNKEVPMGSIAKVMTAYVVIKAGDLSRVITVPSGITGYDKKYGASTAGLKPGEKLTAHELLYALLVPSGCDAAYALAESYGSGHLSRFIDAMNAAAKSLGLTKTHFTDFSGLPDPTASSTYSDARDLISLGRDAMGLPVFAAIVKLAGYHLAAAPGKHPAFTWTNTNPLLGHYTGAIGIKTGQTNAAGACLLFEARRGKLTLIGVVLDSGDELSYAASDAEKILNWDFGRA